jgi:hypothetical protein
MTARRHASIAALSLAALLAAAGSAAAETGACRDDLIRADQNIHRSRANLQQASTGTPAVKCTAFRQHVAALNGVKAVITRCDTGPNKAANAAQTNAAIAEFARQVRETCAAGGGATKKN